MALKKADAGAVAIAGLKRVRKEIDLIIQDWESKTAERHQSKKVFYKNPLTGKKTYIPPAR